jgi:hypothetical protein
MCSATERFYAARRMARAIQSRELFLIATLALIP